MPIAAALPAIASVAGAVISAKSANKGKPATSGGPYNEQSTSSQSQQTTGWDQAQGALGQIMNGANTLYDPNEQLAQSTQAGLGQHGANAIQQGADSLHTANSQQYANGQRNGDGSIGSGDITSYAQGLYNNKAIQDQMAGLEQSANRRLGNLVSGSRDSFDANGTYNSGMARQAERDLRRDTAEGLNNAEMAFRGSQYNNNMNLASNSLVGNRNDMNQGNTDASGFGQQGLNNLQGAANVQQGRLQNQADLDTLNANNQMQHGRDQVESQSSLVNPMAQAYGQTTQNGSSDTQGVSATATGATNVRSPLGEGLQTIGQMDFRTDAEKAKAARVAKGVG